METAKEMLGRILTEWQICVKDIARYCAVSVNTVSSWRDGLSKPSAINEHAILKLENELNKIDKDCPRKEVLAKIYG